MVMLNMVRVRSTSGKDENLAVYNRKEKREKIRKLKNAQAVKRFYENHPEKKQQHYRYSIAWSKKNPERQKIYSKRWYKKKGKEYYRLNRPKILAYRRLRNLLLKSELVEVESCQRTNRNDT